MARVGQGRSGVVGYIGGVAEIAQFLWARRLWWLVPVVLSLLVLSMLIFLASSTPASPFIYSLF